MQGQSDAVLHVGVLPSVLEGAIELAALHEVVGHQRADVVAQFVQDLAAKNVSLAGQAEPVVMVVALHFDDQVLRGHKHIRLEKSTSEYLRLDFWENFANVLHDDVLS